MDETIIVPITMSKEAPDTSINNAENLFAPNTNLDLQKMPQTCNAQSYKAEDMTF